MDIRHNTATATIDYTPIVQLENLHRGKGDYFSNTPVNFPQSEVELTEENYCPLPEYCLIEDKWKYLAGLM